MREATGDLTTWSTGTKTFFHFTFHDSATPHLGSFMFFRKCAVTEEIGFCKTSCIDEKWLLHYLPLQGGPEEPREVERAQLVVPIGGLV